MSDQPPSLTEALAGLPNKQVVKGPMCTVGKLLIALEAAEQKALVDVVDNVEVSANLIAETLGQAGHRVSDQAIRRHRRRQRAGGCLCSR